MTKKKFELLIRVDKDWLSGNDLDDLRQWLSNTKASLEAEVIDKVTDQIMANIDIPKIEMSKEDLYKVVLDKMAERVIEGEEK